MRTIPIGREDAELEWIDNEDLQGDLYYFSRTHLKDGRMIWTSPVYVRNCRAQIGAPGGIRSGGVV